MSNDVEVHDLVHFLEKAVEDIELDEVDMGNTMAFATLEQLHDIVAFAERLKTRPYRDVGA